VEQVNRMTWTPIRIDGPAKPKPSPAEERAGEQAKKRQRREDAAKAQPKPRALEAYFAPSTCPLRAEREADITILEGLRPKCLQTHGEHVCVLAGPTIEGQRDPAHPWKNPAPPRPRHASDHHCACGATWS
jgi:hypothetical protein